jgi:hypothetical protein
MNLHESALAPSHFSAGTVEKLVQSQLFSIIRITMIYVHSWVYLQAEFGAEERIELEREGTCVCLCVLSSAGERIARRTRRSSLKNAVLEVKKVV